MIVFAMFRRSAQKAFLIEEYIRSCMVFMTVQKEKQADEALQIRVHRDMRNRQSVICAEICTLAC